MRSMTMMIAGLAVVPALAAAATTQAPHAQQPTLTTLPPSAQSAASTVDAFHAALARGDTSSAAALLADDALVFEDGGVERSKAEYVAHHLSADAAFSKAVSSSVTRRSGSSNVTFAWIASEGRMTGTYRGKAVDRKMTETMVLRRVGRGWKIVHIHWSSAAAS